MDKECLQRYPWAFYRFWKWLYLIFSRAEWTVNHFKGWYASLKQGHEVRIFLMSAGVEIEK